ncbi:FAD/NAD(P)-binding domain-containing protein [Meredithblackwellia eburnea MCA 4105]
MSDGLNIVIVGAGLCGLACARALREKHNVTIIEKSRMSGEVGATVTLAANATRILLGWGYDPRRAGSLEAIGFREFNADTGEFIVEKPVDSRGQYGSPFFVDHRVDLHRELMRLATSTDAGLPGKPAQIRLATPAKQIDCEAGKITLVNGEVLSADVIIGADGIHSIVRAAVVGKQSSPKPTGRSVYRSLIPTEKILTDPELAFLATPKGERNNGTPVNSFINEKYEVVCYPCRDFKLLNLSAKLPDSECHETGTEDWTDTRAVQRMMDSFKTVAPNLQRLLSYATSCILWTMLDHDPLDVWAKGKTIIAGDAAHAMLPTLGQGGCQAMEDAEAIGVLLSDLTQSSANLVPERLKLIEKVRIERANTILLGSRAKMEGKKNVDGVIVMDVSEFNEYNYTYKGCVDWAKRKGISLPPSCISNVDIGSTPYAHI